MVAWMVMYTHCIWLATLRVVGCGPDGDEMWRLLLGFVPFVFGFAFLLGAINRLPEVAQLMRWLAIPFVLLIPLAAWPVVTALLNSTLGGASICDVPAGWHSVWAPVQLLTLMLIGFMIVRTWQKAAPLANVKAASPGDV